MKIMKNNKTLVELKAPQMESIHQAFYAKILSISQVQAVIKLTEKKHYNKQYVKN